MTSKSAMSPCIQPKKKKKWRDTVKGGRQREERKRKDLKNVLPSSKTQNIYIFFSSSCLSHFPSCPFIHFHAPSLSHHPLPFLTPMPCFGDLLPPPAQVQLHFFLPSSDFLPPSSFYPKVEHKCMNSIRTNTQLSRFLSGTFQWRTQQTFSTACWNVAGKTRSSSPAMLINQKQALAKVGVLAMMLGGETGILLLEEKDPFQMLGGSVNSLTVTDLRLAKSHV